LRSFGGEYLPLPLLVEAIAFDPLLSKTKIIPDCWDPRDLKPKETTFPDHWKRWAKTTFPVVDMVSFSGSELASELSWNCGEE